MLYKISRIIILIIMVVIFCFSSQVNTKSSSVSTGVTETILNIVPIVKKFPVEQKHTIAKNIENFVRKMAHFSIFALLGFFVLLSMQEYKSKLGVFKIILISLIICMFYATTDELHQLFVTGRACRTVDVLIDTAGSITAFIFFYLVLFIKKLLNNNSK